MKKLFLVLTAFLSLLFSCEKVEDPDLGSFRSWEPYLDMSQKNRFDESLFCKEWVVRKRYLETYVDGIIQFKEDHTYDSTLYNYIFNGDYTMSYGTLTGSWLYSHNYLMWRLPIGIFSAAMEVQNVTSDVLTLPGCFAAGDCVGAPYQIAKAVGDGNVAAHAALDYLAETEESE